MNQARNVPRARRDLPESVRFWLAESVPVTVGAFAGLIVLNHLATTRWLDEFLYNGDSLLLPLIRRSMGHREHFRWVFSSQLFIFPEAPLYWLSSLSAGRMTICHGQAAPAPEALAAEVRNKTCCQIPR